jgi:hypothetical protein
MHLPNATSNKKKIVSNSCFASSVNQIKQFTMAISLFLMFNKCRTTRLETANSSQTNEKGDFQLSEIEFRD